MVLSACSSFSQTKDITSFPESLRTGRKRTRKQGDFYLSFTVDLGVVSVSQICIMSSLYCEGHNSIQSFFALADLSKIVLQAFSSKQ